MRLIAYIFKYPSAKPAHRDQPFSVPGGHSITENEHSKRYLNLTLIPFYLTESSGMEVSGSLGGVGVVSLCGGVHARVCSAGRAAAPPPALYRAPGGAALTFGLTRKYCDTGE